MVGLQYTLCYKCSVAAIGHKLGNEGFPLKCQSLGVLGWGICSLSVLYGRVKSTVSFQNGIREMWRKHWVLQTTQWGKNEEWCGEVDLAWERNEWAIGRGFRWHRDDQIGFFKPDDRLDLTEICPRSRAGKQNLLTKSKGLGWNGEKVLYSVGGCYLRWGAFDPGASGGPGRLPKTKEQGESSVTPEVRVKYQQ